MKKTKLVRVAEIGLGLFLIFGNLLLCFAQMPRFKSAAKIGGNLNDNLFDKHVNPDGSSIVLTQSNSRGNITVGTTTIQANSPISGSSNTSLVMKFTKNQQLAWVRKSSNKFYFNRTWVGSNGNIYLTGGYQDSIRFGNRVILEPAGNFGYGFKLTLSQNNEVLNLENFLPKYSVNYQRNLSDVAPDEKIYSMRSRFFQDPNTGMNEYYQDIIKIDQNGNLIDSISLGWVQEPKQLKIKNNKIYLLGSYSYRDSLAPDWNLPPFPDSIPEYYYAKGRAYIAVFDTSLNFIQAKVPYNGGGPNPGGMFSSILFNHQNEAFIFGDTYGDTLTMDSVVVTNPYSSIWQRSTAIIIKLDSELKTKWIQAYFLPTADFSMYYKNIDSIGHLHISGLTPNLYPLPNGQVLPYYYLMRMNGDGKVIAARSFLEFGNNCDLNPDSKGNLIGFGGYSYKSADLDSMSLTWTPTYQNLNPTYNWDSYVARLGNCNLSNPTLSGPSNQSFCQGDSLTLSCSPFQKYQWSTGDSTQSISIKKPGAYHCYIYDSLGCYARSQTIVVNEIPIKTSNLSVSICSNESYLGYDTSGIYIDTLVSSLGCDSIRTLNLSIKPKITFSQNIRLCQNQTLQVGTRIYTQAGIYLDTLAAANGCDSIVTSTLNYDIPNNSIQLSAELVALAAPDQDSYQWLDCNAGFAPITGETDSSFAPDLLGSYAVRVTKGSCADTSNCLFLVNSEPKVVAKSGLNIFPNPAQGYTTIECSSCKEGQIIEIFSADGTEVKSLTINTARRVIVEGLPAGIYLLHVQGRPFTREKLVIW